MSSAHLVRPRLRQALGALLLAVVLLPTAACGQRDPVAVDDFVGDLQRGMGDVKTLRMIMQDGEGHIFGDGQIDLTRSPYSVLTHVDGSALGLEGELEVRRIGRIGYLNFGARSSGRFVRIDPADPSVPPEVAVRIEGADPLAPYVQLEHALVSVTYRGEETVEDQPLDHYEAVTDTGRFPPERQQPGMPDQLTYHFWVDDRFRMRRMMLEAGDEEMVVTVTAVDSRVTIEKPDRSQVITWAQYTGGSARAAS